MRASEKRFRQEELDEKNKMYKGIEDKDKIKINFIQPYGFYNDIDVAYTKAVEQCQDWICITDHDTLKPPGFADRIQQVIKEHGKLNRMFTCRTNRVAKWYEGTELDLYDETNINKHLQRAEDLWEKNSTKITKTVICPGYCMVFHKELFNSWEPLSKLTAAYEFDGFWSSQSECYLMEGVFIFHMYRWGRSHEEIEQSYISKGHTKDDHIISHLQNPNYFIKNKINYDNNSI